MCMYYMLLENEKNESYLLSEPQYEKSQSKGALDKYNIIPQLSPKKIEIFILLKVLAWIMTAC